MLDIIFQNRIIGMGTIYDFGGLWDNVLNGKEFSSEYAKREEKVLPDIEKLIAG